MNAREKEVTARHYLLRLDEIPALWKRKEWDKLAAVVEYARNGVPADLSRTDPYMYRGLCLALCEYHIRGYDGFNLERLRQWAAAMEKPGAEKKRST